MSAILHVKIEENVSFGGIKGSSNSFKYAACDCGVSAGELEAGISSNHYRDALDREVPEFLDRPAATGEIS